MESISIQTVSTVEDKKTKLLVMVYALSSEGLIDSVKEYLSELVYEYDGKSNVSSSVQIVIALTPEITKIKQQLDQELNEAITVYNVLVQKIGKGPDTNSSFCFSYSLEEDKPVDIDNGEPIEAKHKPKLINTIISIPFFVVGISFIGGAAWLGIDRLLQGLQWLENDSFIIGWLIVLLIFGAAFLEFAKDALYKGRSEEKQALIGPFVYYVFGLLLSIPSLWSVVAGSVQAYIPLVVSLLSILYGLKLASAQNSFNKSKHTEL